MLHSATWPERSEEFANDLCRVRPIIYIYGAASRLKTSNHHTRVVVVVTLWWIALALAFA